jgi:RNA polymerase sigma factor (sigma-70 family)
MMPDDMTLVREFAATQSEPAFAALVERHVALVHSAALRQTSDVHLAEEITQAVFIVLARKASSLGEDTILPAWLYRATRYATADALKRQRRRQAREQEAYMQSALPTDDPGAAWQQLAPLLDDVMDQLSERDRAPLVLRYFENRPWREIAGLMRVNEDAAQKRVARALEKLRELFAKRGLTLTAALVAGAVSANSVPAAPAGLAAKISAAALAGTAATTATIIATTKTIAMTTLQKIAVTAALAVTIGAGLYEARQAQAAQNTVAKLQAELAPRAGQIQELQNNFADATNRLAESRAENSRLRSNPQASELLRLRGEVGVLKNQASPALQSEKLSGQAEFTRDDEHRLGRASVLMTDLIGNAYGLGQGRLPANFNQFTNLLGQGHAGAFFEQVTVPELGQFDFFNFGTDVFVHDAQGVTLNPEFKHRLVVCREKIPRQGPDGIWYRIYGVVDLGGNLIEATSTDGNFNAWEKANVIFAVPPQ